MIFLKVVTTLFLLYVFIHELFVSTLKDFKWTEGYWVFMIIGFSISLVLVWV